MSEENVLKINNFKYEEVNISRSSGKELTEKLHHWPLTRRNKKNKFNTVE